MQKHSANSSLPTNDEVSQRPFAPLPDFDTFLLLSPSSQSKTDQDYCSDDDNKENKENVSPSETTCSTITPLKPVSKFQHLRSSERTPLSDISHFFCPKPKRLEVFFSP